MKSLTVFLIFIPFISFAQSSDCDNYSNFGDITICLPELVDMTECYSDPLVKITADMFKGTVDEEIIGVYLFDEIFESRYESFFEDGIGDSFIKIYSTNILKNKKANTQALDFMSSYMQGAFENFHQSKLKSKIEANFNDLDLSISFEKPIMLEEYQLSTKIRSFIILLKYVTDVEDFIQVASLNMMLIKDRLIFFAFYDKYKGFSEIEKTKEMSDYFALRFLKENSK